MAAAATDFKDYYATLGVDPKAPAPLIKRAYRKLARKYHPDVSKEPDAENHFKEVAEAHEALIDPERRAAYDDLVERRAQGRPFATAQDGGYEFGGRGQAPRGNAEDFSAFFESLFGHARGGGATAGNDHHAHIDIDLEDAYRGALRTVSLRRPVVDAVGRAALQDHQVEVRIPRGLRPGQRLRLTGQGEPGSGGAPAGDLYLEIGLHPHPRFRVEGADLWVDLPVAPWEAALGATVPAPTPEGDVQLVIPAASRQGSRLRLKGRGLPGKVPGDLYAVLQIKLPPAQGDEARTAYGALASAFPGYDARA